MLTCTALSTVGCGSGFNQAALEVKPDSGSTQVGAMKINGVVVVADPVTRDAEVIAAIANTGTGADQLVSVTANGLPATVHPAAEPVNIAGGSAVNFGQPERPALVIPGASLTPGKLARVEFGFGNAGQGGVYALIEPNTGLYQGYDPNPASLSSPSPSAKPTTPASNPASIPPENPVSSPSSSSATTLAKASTTLSKMLARPPHLHGSSEPHR